MNVFLKTGLGVRELGVMAALCTLGAAPVHASVDYGACDDLTDDAEERLEEANECLGEFESCAGEDDLTCIEFIDQWESSLSDARKCRAEICEDLRDRVETIENDAPEGCDLLTWAIFGDEPFMDGPPSLDCYEYWDQLISAEADAMECESMVTEASGTLHLNHACVGFEEVPPMEDVVDTDGDGISDNWDPCPECFDPLADILDYPEMW